jgi:hypothetical protein
MVQIHVGQPAFIGEDENSEIHCKGIAKVSERFFCRGMTFPVTVKFHSAKVKIFPPSPSNPFYRICDRTGGRSRFQAFQTFAKPKK